MSKSAQRPPESPSALERAGKATAELLLLALSGLAGTALAYVLLWLGVLPDMQTAPWSAILMGPIVLGVAGLSYRLLEQAFASEDPPRPIEVLEGRKRAGLAVGLLIALATIAVAMIGSVLLALAQEHALSIEVEEQRPIVELVARGDPFELTVLAVSAVVLAPLSEELLFRHMFFRRLLQRAGPLAAWTLPALTFGLSHGNVVGLMMYAWLGTMFAGAYLLSGRLWVAVLGHAGYNALALTMLLYAPNVVP